VRDIAFEEPIVETNVLAGGFRLLGRDLQDNEARPFVWGFHPGRAALYRVCVAANYGGGAGLPADQGRLGDHRCAGSDHRRLS